MLPARIGGPKPEEKKPGMIVAVQVEKKMPSRIGGPREEEASEGESDSMMSNDQAKDEAVREIISAVENKSESQLKSALEAFVYACQETEDSTEEQPTGAEE